MCPKLNVKRSSYYEWVSNTLIRKIKELDYKIIDDLVVNKYNDLKHAVGPKPIFKSLIRDNENITYYRVKRSYCKLGLRPILKRKPVKTTIPSKGKDNRKDLVNRNFYPAVVGSVLVGDITYLKYGNNNTTFYLSTVIDLSSRAVLGYKISKKMNADIVYNALVEAKTSKMLVSNAIFHSDRGTQYTSKIVKNISNFLGLRLSVGRTGSCYDNAVAESFFSTLKREIGSKFKTYEQGIIQISSWIRYYNNKRLHSTIDYESPIERLNKSLVNQVE